MKRFYCKLCKKMIRVRKYPVIMETSTEQVTPTNRIGVCNWHANSTQSRKPELASMGRGR